MPVRQFTFNVDTFQLIILIINITSLLLANLSIIYLVLLKKTFSPSSKCVFERKQDQIKKWIHRSKKNEVNKCELAYWIYFET